MIPPLFLPALLLLSQAATPAPADPGNGPSPLCPADIPGLSIGGQAFGRDAVSDVRPTFNQAGMPTLHLRLSRAGQRRFTALQPAWLHKAIPLCLGRELLVAPVLAEAFDKADMEITGGRTLAEVETMVYRLRRQLGIPTGAPPSAQDGS